MLKKARKICLLMIVLSICSSLIYLGDIIISIVFFTGLITIGISIYKLLNDVIIYIGGKIKNEN